MPLAQEVLRENVFFTQAHMIMGMAAFQEQDWNAARAYFRRAFNTSEYSEAFWENRLILIHNYFAYVMLIIPLLGLFFAVKSIIKRKKRNAASSAA